MDTVNFKQATHVAAWAVACSISPPAGVIAAIGTLGIGAVGSFCIEVADQVRLAWKRAAYRLAKTPCDSLSPEKNVECLRKALIRLKGEHNQAFQLFEERCELHSEQGQLEWFLKKYESGTCVGQVGMLLETALKGDAVFSCQMVQQMNPEEVFFKQMIHNMNNEMEVGIECIELEVKLENIRRELAQMKFAVHNIPLSADMLTDIQTWKQERLTKCQNMSASLKKKNSIYSCTKTREFEPTIPSEYYQQILDKALKGTSRENALGCVNLPKHVMAFQCTSTGYYLYDSIHPLTGLYRYPTKAIFCEKLRERILQDLEIIRSVKNLSRTKVSFEVLT